MRFDDCDREEKTMMSTMSEIIFEVTEDEIDGGYSANALGLWHPYRRRYVRRASPQCQRSRRVLL